MVEWIAMVDLPSSIAKSGILWECSSIVSIALFIRGLLQLKRVADGDVGPTMAKALPSLMAASLIVFLMPAAGISGMALADGMWASAIHGLEVDGLSSPGRRTKSDEIRSAGEAHRIAPASSASLARPATPILMERPHGRVADLLALGQIAAFSAALGLAGWTFAKRCASRARSDGEAQRMAMVDIGSALAPSERAAR